MTGESLYPRDLIERLRGALDRIEEIAGAVARRSPGPWTVDPEIWATNGTGVTDASGDAVAVAVGSYVAEHLVVNGPDVVLRTIQAHRKILDRCSQVLAKAPKYVEQWELDEIFAELIMRDLASIYFPESEPS